MLMTGGTLFDATNKRGQLSHPQAQAVLTNITDALAHVHALGFIHRDIKPESEWPLRAPHDRCVHTVRMPHDCCVHHMTADCTT